jgi:hypothetical protein
VLARTLEKTGLSTILITNMPFWAEKIGVPRTLAVEHPYGQILGQPHHIEGQMRIIRQALDVLATTESPGQILHSPEIWPFPTKLATENWQPKEPSPVISRISKSFREMMKKRKRNRNP